MKAHIHPYSYTKREHKSTSHHDLFKKQYIIENGGALSFYKESELNQLFAQLQNISVT